MRGRGCSSRLQQVRNENDSDAYAMMTLHLIGFTDTLSRYLLEKNMTMAELESIQDEHEQVPDGEKVDFNQLDFIDKNTGLPNVKLIRMSVAKSMSRSFKTEDKQTDASAPALVRS